MKIATTCFISETGSGIGLNIESGQVYSAFFVAGATVSNVKASAIGRWF
jgi:hypothetical protein